jgi:Domain of Unknown Function with PDB structure (DUF3857)/Transglutaminase-like superfamily
MRLTLLAAVLVAVPGLALAAPDGAVPVRAAPAAEPVSAVPLARPKIAAPPAWIDTPALPRPPRDAEGAATIDLLGDVQVKFGKDFDTFYYGQAWKIGTAHGLDGASLQVDWDPALEVLTIHRYRILRGGAAIDLLGDGARLSVIQREKRMESAMLDGRLTVTLQPEDVRVGDTIDLAYSLERRDPAMAGRSQYVVGPKDGATFGRFRVRMLWGPDKAMNWRVYPGILQPRVKQTSAGSELVADIGEASAPLPPEGAPARFQLVNAIEVTEFSDWAGVSRTFAPLYAKAGELAANSPIKVEAARIAAQSRDPKRRAELALQLVQEQIRYLFMGMNAGGFVPAGAEQTWARRFGDCKAKTVLLIALLTELGIEARPVLVHTSQGDLLAARLPNMEAFDHVIVEAKVAGKSYFLDGTRLGDLSLDRVRTPNWTAGVPVTAAGAALVPLVPEPYDRPEELVSLTLDASRGLDLPAVASAEMRFTGAAASDMRQKYAGFSQADRNRELRKLWRDTYDFVSPGKVATADDPATGDFVVTMSGSAQMEWSRDLGTRWYELDRARLGWRFDIAREGELSPEAPFAFEYPNWWGSRTVVKLPNKGKGFRLQGGSLDKVVGDLYRFSRKVEVADGTVTMAAETRALAAELPADRAARTRSEMAELASNGVFIRAPEDYQQTAEERAQTAREDLAESKAARGRTVIGSK